MEGIHERDCKSFLIFKQTTTNKPVQPLHSQAPLLIRTLNPYVFLFIKSIYT